MSEESEEDAILDFDEDFAELASRANDLVSEALRQPAFPATVMATFGLLCSADSIKLGMIELAQAGNLHGVSILYRSMIEHFVKFQYLLFRWMAERSDEAGKEYELFSLVSERLELGNALKIAAELEGRAFEFDPLSVLKEDGVVSQSFSRGDLKAITNKWTYRSSIRYIAAALHEASEAHRPLPLLARMIPAYAELSSFVHGGKAAERLTARLMNDGADIVLAWEHAKWGCILANSLKVYFFLIVGQEDARFLSHFSALDGRLRQFLREKPTPASDTSG